MKKITVLLLLIGLFSCGQNPSSFSATELVLFKEIGFDAVVLSDLKQYSDKDITQFESSDPGYIIHSDGTQVKTGVEKLEGISFQVDEATSYEIILDYRVSLKEKGYLVFVSKSGFESPSTVSVIKSNDKFDILRLQKTDGINFDLENNDVINKLKEWDAAYGIEILGADYDWVDITFTKDIKNVSKFAKEVYAFCPDAVDQGVGEIKELEQLIKDEKRLFLWWD